MLDSRHVLELSVGATAALLAAPLVALVPGLPARWPPLFGAGVGVFAVVHAGARSAARLPRLFGVPAAVSVGLLSVASGGWFVYAAAVHPPADPAFAVGGAAVLPVAAALIAAHEVRLAEWTETATVVIRFEARASPRARRVGLFGAVALSFSGLVLLAVRLRTAGPTAALAALPLLASGFAWLPALRTELAVRVAEEGVRIGRLHYAWADFESYAATNDAIVFRRSGLRPDRALDRSDIEDPAAVEKVLARYLPEAS